MIKRIARWVLRDTLCVLNRTIESYQDDEKKLLTDIRALKYNNRQLDKYMAKAKLFEDKYRKANSDNSMLRKVIEDYKKQGWKTDGSK